MSFLSRGSYLTSKNWATTFFSFVTLFIELARIKLIVGIKKEIIKINAIKHFITQDSYSIHAFTPKVKKKPTQHTTPIGPATSMELVLSGRAFHKRQSVTLKYLL